MDFEKIIPERFRIHYDSKTGVWRLLDTWHQQIKNISDLSISVPDDSPAMKILSDLELNSLIAHLDKIGWLDQILKKKIELKDLRIDMLSKPKRKPGRPKKNLTMLSD